MQKIKKINKHILLVILIIFFSIKIDFFKSFYNIFSKNYDERIRIVYDFCFEEGIGYLRYIKKKIPKLKIKSLKTKGLNYIKMQRISNKVLIYLRI